jgi:hypothetical protein
MRRMKLRHFVEWRRDARDANFAAGVGMQATEGPTLRFINVDLDVTSADDLAPLIEALEPHTYSFERPPGQASFEINEPSPTDPEVVILELIRLVTSLPPAARRAWDAASKRVFDIGLQSGRHPFHRSYSIGIGTLREAIDIGAEIAITLYALDPTEEDPGQLGVGP